MTSSNSSSGFVVEWEMKPFPDLLAPLMERALRTGALKVLLVAADLPARERIGGWLSDEGHEVIECPGPRSPDYTCLGGRGKDCPLMKGVDVVVLDLNLASDAVLAGTPSWRLLDYYISRGHPVVAVAGPEQIGRFFLDERVITLERPVEREVVLKAIDDAVARRSTVTDIGSFRWTPRRKVHRLR